jgi:protein involved in polysaccharide export with SLBB domain
MKYFQYSDLSLDDTTRYNIDINLMRPLVSCDFVAAFKNASDRNNILLEDGDIIVVPENPGKVYVYGQVNQPGYVDFSENKTIQWYIERAGGFAPYADEGRERIIRGKTLVWVKEGIVYAGDYIYVPRPEDTPRAVTVQEYSVIVSIFLAVLSVASIIINLIKY